MPCGNVVPLALSVRAHLAPRVEIGTAIHVTPRRWEGASNFAGGSGAPVETQNLFANALGGGARAVDATVDDVRRSEG